MNIRTAATVVAALFLLPVAWAQTAGSSGPAPTAPPVDPVASKVGVLNVQAAITNTAEGKQAAAELQSQFTPRQTELENMQKQIQDLQNRLRTGSTTLSDEEKLRLQREGDQLTRSFQRKQQELQDDGSEAQREVVDRIGRKMLEVLDRFAKENGYSLIMDTSSQSTPVVYAANQIDVTQQIIQLYDKAYPVKAAGAATPRPANPRPAVPRPTTPPPSKPPQR
jgi:outer membrane protein